MKIRYKLILIFILIILAATLPLSIFILNQQEKQKLNLITHQGEINSRILARTTLNILLMNGGDISSSMVDAKEMLSILKPLTNDGLIYADAILVSSREHYNGLILARYSNRNLSARVVETDTVTTETVEELKRRTGYREGRFPGVDDVCYEFVSTDSLPGKPAICIGRLVFSKSIVLAPIKQLRKILYGSIVVALIVVTVLGLFFSNVISRPIANLIMGVEKIGGGDLEYRIPVNKRDELGILATTFNHLAQIVKLEIDELRAANVALKRLDVLKDEFLANMSHELRTPLYGIIGIAESLIGGAAGPVSEESVHDLSLIVYSGRRLAAMVNDILDFSKLKHHDIVLSKKAVNMHSLVRLVKAILQPAAEKKTLVIRNRIDFESTIVYGDENRLQQIMLNLIGNAVKFTETGEITITAERDPANDSVYIITVSDAGIGIPVDKKERIFETFEQVDGSTEREFGGTGLGLAITKRLVELHGGRIWLESEPGRGSRFFFTIAAAERDLLSNNDEPAEVPLFAESVASFLEPGADHIRAMSEKGPAGDRSFKRILVIDDEPVNLQVMINYLALEGYDVVTASTGTEGLEKLSREEVDLVLLDLMLPRISGYEVCRIIREKYSLYELPILILTARNKPGDIVNGLGAGANDYLTKPVNKQELLARVNSLISLQVSVKLNNELALIKRDIQIAHGIQNSVLMQEIPKIEGVSIALRYVPMTELGGDFYDVQMIDADQLGILLADVSGHGIPAAFICAMLKVVYSFQRRETINPSTLMRRINATMYNYTGGQFITACYACIDLARKKLQHANAGHWPLLIWRRSEKRIIIESKNCMPIGWSDEEEYITVESDIMPGDRIILYTDGIVEARNASNKMFGEARFHDLIRKYQDCGAEEFVDKTIAAVSEWASGESGKGMDDDVTIVVVDFPG
ncbi:MAG: hypothetical protein A2176_12365 [Spirochaetes bacterium RBG_13_51_14]|nr:MAG: hypothetical protein A2176_12365 [Spirochaetes bacterium RBG_13_51_14]